MQQVSPDMVQTYIKSLDTYTKRISSDTFTIYTADGPSTGLYTRIRRGDDYPWWDERDLEDHSPFTVVGYVIMPDGTAGVDVQQYVWSTDQDAAVRKVIAAELSERGGIGGGYSVHIIAAYRGHWHNWY